MAYQLQKNPVCFTAVAYIVKVRIEPSVLHSSCVHCKSHKYTMKEEEVQSFC